LIDLLLIGIFFSSVCTTMHQVIREVKDGRVYNWCIYLNRIKTASQNEGEEVWQSVNFGSAVIEWAHDCWRCNIL